MTDFAMLRRQLVDNQIRTSAVTEPTLIQAFMTVRRERFVAEAEKPFAYSDRELMMSAAAPMRRMTGAVQQARLIQSLAPAAAARVLVVGAGTGYSAAVLSRMVAEVVALEEDDRLASAADATLRGEGCDNVTVVTERLTEGCPSRAPYDAILVDGAVEMVPPGLIAQLPAAGVLAAIQRTGGVSRAMLYERVGAEHASWPQFDAWAAPLPGFERRREFVF